MDVCFELFVVAVVCPPSAVAEWLVAHFDAVVPRYNAMLKNDNSQLMRSKALQLLTAWLHDRSFYYFMIQYINRSACLWSSA